MGAKIETAKGAPIVCDHVGGNWFTLAQVGRDGSVVGVVLKDDEFPSFQRVSFANYKNGGVEIYLGDNNNPFLSPGEHQTIRVGNYEVTVQGTIGEEVKFNGRKPTDGSKNGRVRYPIN